MKGKERRREDIVSFPLFFFINIFLNIYMNMLLECNKAIMNPKLKT